jgi:hypothetical protein
MLRGDPMAEPTVVCPQCKTEIKLTESLAAPLLESIRRDYEQRLTQKDRHGRREKALHEREASCKRKEKWTTGAEAAPGASPNCRWRPRAKPRLEMSLIKKQKKSMIFTTFSKQRDIKLVDGQKAQADLIRSNELDDAKRELELTVEKRVQRIWRRERRQKRGRR